MNVFSATAHWQRRSTINWICGCFTLALRSVRLCKVYLSSFQGLLVEISLSLKVGHIGRNVLVTWSFRLKPKQQRKIFAGKFSRKIPRSLTPLRSHTANFKDFECKTTALLIFFLGNESTVTQISECGHARLRKSCTGFVSRTNLSQCLASGC